MVGKNQAFILIVSGHNYCISDLLKMSVIVLGNVMVTMSKRALFALHVVFLVIGPLVVLGLLAWVIILTKNTVGKFLVKLINHYSSLFSY